MILANYELLLTEIPEVFPSGIVLLVVAQKRIHHKPCTEAEVPVRL